MATTLESKLLTCHKADLILFLKENPQSFHELSALAFERNNQYSWRAAWLTWSCMNRNDPRIKPYLQTLLEILPNRKSNIQREWLMILHRMELNEEQNGILFDHCQKIWKQTDLQPSVRVNAFKIIAKIADQHPELKNELLFLTQPQYLEPLSKGVKWSVEKRIKTLFEKK